MIRVIQGEIGGGKTYFAVCEMMEALGDGRIICTNVELKIEPIRKYLRRFHKWELDLNQIVVLDAKDIRDFYAKTPAGSEHKFVEVYIDEAQFELNARDWMHQPRELMEFLTTSRHEFTNVTFITQEADNVDKQVRRLVQCYWVCKDMGEVNPILKSFFAMNKFAKNRRTLLPGGGLRFKRVVFFGLYNSFQKLKHFERAKSNEIKNTYVVPWYRKDAMKVFMFMLATLILGGGFMKWRSMKDGVKKEKVVVESVGDNSGSRGLFAMLQGGAVGQEELGASTNRVHDREIDKGGLVGVRWKGRIETREWSEVLTDRGTFRVGQLTQWGVVKKADDTGIMFTDVEGLTTLFFYVAGSGVFNETLVTVQMDSEKSVAGVTVVEVKPPMLQGLSRAKQWSDIKGSGRRTATGQAVAVAEVVKVQPSPAVRKVPVKKTFKGFGYSVIGSDIAFCPTCP